jgi:hypothetical protein
LNSLSNWLMTLMKETHKNQRMNKIVSNLKNILSCGYFSNKSINQRFNNCLLFSKNHTRNKKFKKFYCYCLCNFLSPDILWLNYCYWKKIINRKISGTNNEEVAKFIISAIIKKCYIFLNFREWLRSVFVCLSTRYMKRRKKIVCWLFANSKLK